MKEGAGALFGTASTTLPTGRARHGDHDQRAGMRRIVVLCGNKLTSPRRRNVGVAGGPRAGRLASSRPRKRPTVGALKEFGGCEVRPSASSVRDGTPATRRGMKAATESYGDRRQDNSILLVGLHRSHPGHAQGWRQASRGHFATTEGHAEGDAG